MADVYLCGLGKAELKYLLSELKEGTAISFSPSKCE